MRELSPATNTVEMRQRLTRSWVVVLMGAVILGCGFLVAQVSTMSRLRVPLHLANVSGPGCLHWKVSEQHITAAARAYQATVVSVTEHGAVLQVKRQLVGDPVDELMLDAAAVTALNGYTAITTGRDYLILTDLTNTVWDCGVVSMDWRSRDAYRAAERHQRYHDDVHAVTVTTAQHSSTTASEH